jgi:predicted RNA-binding protein with PIN domain
MKTEKESFIVYKEWNSLIESLDDEERLFFYDTLFNFEGEEIPTYQNKHLQAVVNFVFSRVIENNDKYKEKKKTNSENSKKRWDKFANQNMQSDATAKIAMLNDNVNDNYNNNVNDNENDNENDNVSLKKSKTDFKGDWFVNATADEFIERVNKFKEEHPNHGYPEIMFQDFINCFTMPNKEGGIFLNVHHNFGIMNKLKEWKGKKENVGKYEIKTPKKKIHYE